MPLNNACPLVLLVEDDPDTAALFTAMLRGEGMAVVHCGDCRQAKEWWRAARRGPDLMVLDIRLPDGSGLDLCREFLEPPQEVPTPPVMLLSAHGDPRMPGRCRQAGAQVFLDKLGDLDNFVATARSLLGEMASGVA